MLNLHDIALCAHGYPGIITEIGSKNGDVLYKGVHLSKDKFEQPWQSKDPIRLIASKDLLRVHQHGIIDMPDTIVSLIRKKSGEGPDFSLMRRNKDGAE